MLSSLPFTVYFLCAVLCLVAQLCATLCDPMEYSRPGSSVHGDSLGKNTGVGCPPPGDLSNPGIKPRSSALQADSLPAEPPRKSKDTGVGSLSIFLVDLPHPGIELGAYPFSR